MKDERQEHPSPQVLVDLVEGVPIDAEWTEHLSRCEHCAKEVENLNKTLAIAGESEVPEPEAGYWGDFNSRLNQRLEKDEKRSSSHRLWVAAAAAVLAIGIWVVQDWTTPKSSSPISIETILPPVEEDPEFQVLLSIAKLVDSRGDLEESLDFVVPPILDPTELTAVEQERLRRELERDLEAENHAKS